MIGIVTCPGCLFESEQNINGIEQIELTCNSCGKVFLFPPEAKPEPPFRGISLGFDVPAAFQQAMMEVFEEMKEKITLEQIRKVKKIVARRDQNLP